MEIRLGHAVAIVLVLLAAGGIWVGWNSFSPAQASGGAATLGSDPLQSGQGSPILQANGRAAEAKVRNAIPSIEAYYADHGSYLGITVEGLRAAYDPGLDPALVIPAGSVTAQSYCVQLAGIGSTLFHYSGPTGDVVAGPCP